MGILVSVHGDAMIVIEHAINHVRVYSWRGYEFKPTGKHREYAIGNVKPNYPMPAIHNHLNLIAGEPMLAWEDFKAIGHHGQI